MKRQKESRVTSPIAGQPQRLTCPSHLKKIGHRRGRRSTRMAARSKHPKSKRVATKITLFRARCVGYRLFRSGLARHRSALCMVVGTSLGPLVFRRYASSLGCHWPVLVAGGPTCHRAILLVVGLSLGPYSSSLGRGQGLLIVVGTSLGPTRFHCWVVLLSVVGSSFPHVGVICVTMVGVSWSCLIRYASVGRNVGVEHMWSEVRKKEKNDENEPRSKLWFGFVTY